MKQACPWCGLDCDCDDFPYLTNGLVPQKCGDKIASELPYLVTVRKLSPEQKQAAFQQIDEDKRRMAEEKKAKKASAKGLAK